MKNIFIIALMSVFSTLVHADDVTTSLDFDDVTIKTRFGDLKTVDMNLTYKGKPVHQEITLPSDAYVMNKYTLSTSDVILVSQAAGTGCPGLFAYVTVSTEGAKATPLFGTCYDDDIEPVVSDETISFSMKGLGGIGSTRYIYERGVVFENGKPIK